SRNYAGAGVRIAPNAGTRTIFVAGNLAHTGTALVSPSILIDLTGTGTQSVSQSSTGDIGDLEISNTTGLPQRTSNFTVGDDITVDAGAIWDLQDFDLTGQAGTVLTNNGRIRLDGEQTFTNATPTNNGGSVIEYTATSGTRAIK